MGGLEPFHAGQFQVVIEGWRHVLSDLAACSGFSDVVRETQSALGWRRRHALIRYEFIQAAPVFNFRTVGRAGGNGGAGCRQYGGPTAPGPRDPVAKARPRDAPLPRDHRHGRRDALRHSIWARSHRRLCGGVRENTLRALSRSRRDVRTHLRRQRRDMTARLVMCVPSLVGQARAPSGTTSIGAPSLRRRCAAFQGPVLGSEPFHSARPFGK